MFFKEIKYQKKFLFVLIKFFFWIILKHLILNPLKFTTIYNGFCGKTRNLFITSNESSYKETMFFN